MMTLTRELVEAHLLKIEESFERGVSAISWMGIQVSWLRKPKIYGGNTLRNKIWGVWEYNDCLSGKDMTREEAIAEILKPFEERKAKQDLTDIEYCAMCGNIAIGEKEQLWWGRLSYTHEVAHNNSTDWDIPHHTYVDICGKCCQKIIRGDYV